LNLCSGSSFSPLFSHKVLKILEIDPEVVLLGMLLLERIADIFFGGLVGEEAPGIGFSSITAMAASARDGHGTAKDFLNLIPSSRKGHLALSSSSLGERFDRIGGRNGSTIHR
jgi:hypothetical protein